MARRGSSLGWILVPIGLAAAAIAGAWQFTGAAGRVVHPDPQAIASVTQTAPARQWSEAVARARRIVRAGVAEQNVPGLSVAVGVGGDSVWAEGFGWADVKARVPVTPDTRFRIGTASTVLTSVAAGVLLEKGRLTLDDEIQKYVPQFPKKRWPVTLRQLMANTGGVGTDEGDEGPLFLPRCEQPVEALQYFGSGALLFQPGTQYRHSKYGWILVSAAVEAAADEPFLTLMHEQIFEPLGMDNTGAESATTENPERIGEPEEDPPFLTFFRQMVLEPLGIVAVQVKPATDPATVYAAGSGFNPRVGYGLSVVRPHNLSCYAGAMAFYSTASDLVRFGLAINGGKLLQPATAEMLQTSQQLTSGQATGHGLGWDLETVTLAGQPTQAAGHDGEVRGRRVTSLLMFRERGIVVAVTANLADADTTALALAVAEAFAQVGR